MKRILKLTYLILIITLLTGCSFGVASMDRGIKIPEAVNIGIEGSYTFLSVVPIEGAADLDESQFRGMTAYFDVNTARVGDEMVSDPNYKVKLVGIYDFLLSKYRVNPARLNLQDDEMEVIDINTENTPFYQLFRLSDEIIGIIQGRNFIKFSRLSTETVSNREGVMSAAEKGGIGIATEDAGIEFQPKAGVLIGLKTPRSEASGGASAYRTLWIANDGNVQFAYSAKDLLFPRKEFFQLGVSRNVTGDKVFESLAIRPVNRTVVMEDTLKGFVATTERILDIDFVGNDYIGISRTSSSANLPIELPETLILAVDKYLGYKGVTITELAGIEGEEALRRSYESAREKDSNIPAGYDMERLMENLSLQRRNGHWILNARVNSARNGGNRFYDFPVSIIPPQKLVTYDELDIPWNKVKAKVPEAIDVFNAPGNSFLLVRTPKYLMMFAITPEHEISQEPLQVIAVKEEEEIIMAEWARGDFVDRWTEILSATGSRVDLTNKEPIAE
jgi:hypothetical protein